MSEPKKRGRPRKSQPPTESYIAGPATTAGPIMAEADAPRLQPPDTLEARKRKSIAVLERRLGGGALFDQGSTTIPFKDPDMIGRWFNRAISADKFYKAEHQKGWIKVTIDDVANADAVSGYTITPERYITRGPRGEEMLYMISKEMWERIRWAKDAANKKRLGTRKQRAEVVAEATAAQFGDEAADFIQREGGPVVESYRGSGMEWPDEREE